MQWVAGSLAFDELRLFSPTESDIGDHGIGHYSQIFCFKKLKYNDNNDDDGDDDDTTTTTADAAVATAATAATAATTTTTTLNAAS